MPATTKAQTAKANAAAETFTDAEGDLGQLAQVLAALAGLTNKFAGVETTVSDLAARQVALESAHITGTEAAAAVLAEPELEPEAESEPAPEAGGGVGAVSAEVKLAQLEQQLAVLTAQTAAGASVHTGRQADPIPFALSPFLRPEHHRLQQAAGARLPVNLWTAEQYETACPGYSLLNPGARAELEYALVSVARLGDVLDHIEDSGAGAVEFDIRRSSQVLFEIYTLQKERLDGVFRRASIAANKGLDGENDGAITGRMEAKRQARMLAGDLSQADNVYATEAAELDTAVKERTTKLLAYPLAAARLESLHGSGFAAKFAKSWPMQGGHNDGDTGKPGKKKDAGGGGGDGGEGGGGGDGIVGRRRGR